MKIMDNLISLNTSRISRVVEIISEYERSQIVDAVTLDYNNVSLSFVYEGILKRCLNSSSKILVLVSDYNFVLPLSDSAFFWALKLEEHGIKTYCTYSKRNKYLRIEKMINDYYTYLKEGAPVLKEITSDGGNLNLLRPLNNFTLALAFQNGIINSSFGDFENLCKRKGIEDSKAEEKEILYLSYILNNGLTILKDTIMVDNVVPETNFNSLLKKFSEPNSK